MSPVTDSLAPGDVLGDTYRIVRLIGRGGMGEVYEATHARLAGRYAVKLLLSDVTSQTEALSRFRQEAQITAQLRHPNIVQVIDFAATPAGAPYMVMELIEGRDLAEELLVTGPLPPARVADIVEQVAAGLAAAHAEGVVHRDLKPANVFLTRLRGSDRELAKIVDFGISKVRASGMNLTSTKVFMGTPQYMSPEQASGRAHAVDAATDQFALAVMAYEMLTGRVPFQAEELPALVYQVVHEPAPAFTTVGAPAMPTLEAVLARGMSKKPEERFASVTEMARALAAAAGDSAVAAASTPFFRPAVTTAIPVPTTLRGSAGIRVVEDELAPRPRSKGLLWLAASVLMLLAVTSVALLGRESSAPPTSAAPTKPQETIAITIEGAPPGLEVHLDGEAVRPPLRLPRGERRHRLAMKAPGHLTEERWIEASADQVIRPALRPEPPAEAPPPPPPPGRQAPKTAPKAASKKVPKKTNHVVTDL